MLTERERQLDRVRKRRWRLNHPDSDSQYYLRTREARRIKAAGYYRNNAEYIKAKSRKYYFETKEVKRMQRSKAAYQWTKKFRKTPDGKAALLVRALLQRVLSYSGKRKLDKTTTLIGYNKDQLRLAIELKFKDGMSWENFGEVWELDHIKPVAVFIREGIYDPAIINALDNLQPLFIHEHKSKTSMFMKDWRGALS